MSDTRTQALRTQAGAVNAMWLIVIMILWIATLGLLYVTNSEVAKFQDDAASARASEQRANDRLDEANNTTRSLSEQVGYRDASVFGSTSDSSAIRAEIDSAKGLLGPALGGEDTEVTLDQTVKALASALTAARTAAGAAKNDFSTEQAARAAAEAKVADIESTYRDQVASLQRELDEEQQRADTQKTNDQARIDQVTADNDSANADSQSTRRELDDLKVQAQKDMATAAAQLSAIALQRQPIEPEKPDGSVLAVSDDATVAWIDIGGRDGLRNGTRFDLLRRGKAGELYSRGKVEVREVETDMSMIGLIGEVDVFDPMLEGDLVLNPHFAKGESLHFYLLGDFPLTLSKEFVAQRLDELGSHVDEAIGVSTDVLVVGDESLAEGEFATPLSETEEYQLAEKLGMRIVRLDELAGFLRY